MKINILGGGPAGLYSGLLIKKANPAHEITIFERNPADVTYGWGVVFSDRTLASFQILTRWRNVGSGSSGEASTSASHCRFARLSTTMTSRSTLG